MNTEKFLLATVAGGNRRCFRLEALATVVRVSLTCGVVGAVLGRP